MPRSTRQSPLFTVLAAGVLQPTFLNSIAALVVGVGARMTRWIVLQIVDLILHFLNPDEVTIKLILLLFADYNGCGQVTEFLSLVSGTAARPVPRTTRQTPLLAVLAAGVLQPPFGG